MSNRARRHRTAAFSTLAALLASPALAAGPGRVDVEAAPRAVTVYNDQATVTRAGTAQVPAGDSLLVVSGIPAGVVADSVTAKGRGGSKVSIGSVEVRQATFDTGSADKRRAELAARIAEVDALVAAVDVRISGFAAQQSFIDRLAQGYVDTEPTPPGILPQPQKGGRVSPAAEGVAADPSEWRAAWAAIREGTAEAAEGMRLAHAERQKLVGRRAELEAEMNSRSGNPGPGTLEVVVAVRAERATSFDLDLSYQIRNASWRPVYEARLDSVSGQIALRQEAVVVQRTGEDWQDVAVTLSTARPSVGVTPPKLGAWRIDLAPSPEELRAQRLAEGNAYSSMAAPAAAPAPARNKALEDVALAEVAGAQAVDAVSVAAAPIVSGLSVEYAIPGRATVRSDGTERRVRVGDAEAASTLALKAVPKSDPRAYLHAHFANGSGLPLLPGSVSLYLDGVFVGKDRLPLVRPEEKVALPFGPDDRVKVTYEPQERKRSEDGLLWGKRALTASDALITVRSYHERPVEVTVLDQAPVASHADIQVEVKADPQPTAKDVEDRPGVVAWTATLGKGEERKIRFGYTITAPEGRVVTGLGR